MIELDGTENKAAWARTRMLGVSLAIANAAAEEAGSRCTSYLGGSSAAREP